MEVALLAQSINMRKAQEKLLVKAKKSNFSKPILDVLSREDVTIDQLEHIYSYLYVQTNAGIEDNAVIAESNKCIDFLNKKYNLGYIKNASMLKELMSEMLPLNREDTLCGDQNKMRIYHAYQFTKKQIVEENGPFGFNFKNTTYSVYVEMLYCHVDNKAISTIVKSIVRSNDRSLKRDTKLLDRYSCLKDDLINNGVESLMVYLSKNNMIAGFNPNDKELEQLYDFELHRFIFKYEDFFDYFFKDDVFGAMYRVDSLKIAHRKLTGDSFIENMAKFLKQKDMRILTYMPESDVFLRQETGSLFDNNKLKTYKQCAEMMGSDFKIKLPAWSMTVNIQTNMFVSIEYKEYDEITVSLIAGYFNKTWYPNHTRKSAEIFITPDQKFFKRFETKGGYKTMPLPMSEVISYMSINNLFGEFITWIVDYFSKTNRFVKDVVKDLNEVECILPMSFNDVLECYNKTHFFHTKYKTSVGMNVNWNKKNINLSYMIIKAYPKVEDGISKRFLLQQKKNSLVQMFDPRSKLDVKLLNFLTNVIKENVVQSEMRVNNRQLEKSMNKLKKEIADEVGTEILEDEYDTWVSDRVDDHLSMTDINRDIYDYVRMCLVSKKKVRLDVKSTQQLINLHDAAAHGDGSNHYRRHAGAVTIPKNTKFKQLRNILPEEFEWIKSRKRLILETELQHHCVWSYAGKISDDNCAIYSFVDTNAEHTCDGKAKRYTIEFGVNQNNIYHIVQVQGKYDRVHTDEMRQYIQSILDEKQKENA